MTTRVRFAPSPTGKLHLGNVRTAVINWLFAKNAGGIFLLRMDDTDAERSKVEFEEGIKKDLTWLGLEWDEFAQQSHRLDRYDEIAEKLKADGRLYPAYETTEELGLMRKSLLQRGKPPIYDRAALNLSDADRADLEAKGRKPHWRFKLNDGEMAWTDLVRGDVRFEAQNISDPVLIREDGRPLYTLSSVVDDADLGVTDIIRGEDHVTNSAVQVQLFEAIGASMPNMGHLPLVTDKDGEKLSKRFGSLAVEQMRDVVGFEPLAIDIFLAKLGTPEAASVFENLAALAEDFDIARYGRATPKMDVTELESINAKLVRSLPFSAVSNSLPNYDEELWNSVSANLDKLGDAEDWHRILRGDVTPMIEDEDKNYIHGAAAHLPDGNWGETSWQDWTNALKEATGRKGKGLFMPLRLALTGQARGPEMAVLFPLLDRSTVEKRLSA